MKTVWVLVCLLLFPLSSQADFIFRLSETDTLKTLKTSNASNYLPFLDLYIAPFPPQGVRPIFIEEDRPIEITNLPDDPLWQTQWSLDPASDFFGLPLAWEKTTGSREVIVAILDTGVDLDHPDLRENLWTNDGEVPGNGADDDKNGYVDDVFGYDFFENRPSLQDFSGHGTHLAGIIGGVGNNGIGISGVNWQVRILSLKVAGVDGIGTTSAVLRALDYALGQGVRIINASWIVRVPPKEAARLDSLKSAFEKLEEADLLFVTSSGNAEKEEERKDLDRFPLYPASFKYPNLLSVAATDEKGELASFSNYGRYSVDLAAPGVSLLSTLPGGEYGRMSGTSMATAFASGAAALLLAVEPDLDAVQLAERLKGSAKPHPSLESHVASGGFLDADQALRLETSESASTVEVISPPAGCSLIP